jgi:steroid delta-isomerase-like uncharacterized protein
MHLGADEIARRYYAALDAADAGAIERVVTPDLLVETSGRTFDMKTFLSTLELYRDAFPDLRRKVLQLTTEGDRVAAVVEISGTHTGTFLSHPPTGRSFRARSIDVLETSDGQVARVLGVFDTIGMLAQLGLYDGAPPRQAASEEQR